MILSQKLAGPSWGYKSDPNPTQDKFQKPKSVTSLCETR